MTRAQVRASGMITTPFRSRFVFMPEFVRSIVLVGVQGGLTSRSRYDKRVRDYESKQTFCDPLEFKGRDGMLGAETTPVGFFCIRSYRMGLESCVFRLLDRQKQNLFIIAAAASRPTRREGWNAKTRNRDDGMSGRKGTCFNKDPTSIHSLSQNPSACVLVYGWV